VRLLIALARAVLRELRWGLADVSREVERWRTLASSITDDALRHDALQAIDSKRANIDGAALFWTLPRVRSHELLRLLVAYEILADFLDCASERAAEAGTANGLALHRALIEALDPGLPLSDYYRLHPWREDGGYVRALVDSCRESCVRLPSYEAARPLLTRAASLAQVLALNHDPLSERRDQMLRAWADTHFAGREEGLAWFEWSGGASAWLTILALLALAAEPGRDARDARDTDAAYLPWISLVGTMLDSYGDVQQDAANAEHSYIAHYPSADAAGDRIGELIRRSLDRGAALRDGERHLVLVACMIAMYLSKDSVRVTQTRAMTRGLVHAAGPLTRLLLPVLRLWRVLDRQREVSTRQRPAPQVSASPRRRPRASTKLGARRARDALPPSAPLPATLQTLAFGRNPHAYLEWCRRRYGTRFTVRAVGMAPLVFMSDPADIRAIVRAPADVLHPGAGASVIAPLVGDGSFMLAEEDEHLKGRRAIMPAFHQRVIAEHAEMVREVVERELASWPLEQAVAIHPYLRALTLRVILHTVFGGQSARLQELHTRLLAMLSVTASLALQEPQLRCLPYWRGIWRRFLADRAEVDRLLYSLIEDEAHGRSRERGLLSMLAGAGSFDSSQSSARRIRDDLMSVILAGHETTASELAWAFQLLAHDPVVTERLVDDLDGGGERYLTATIQEVLRHRPVFLFTIPRAVRRPLQIAARTYRPPASLVGCIHLMQHDPDIYPDPDAFRPERFLDGSPPGEIWMPWGGGRKRCPGQHLAMLELRTVLDIVLSQLELKPVGRAVETARWRSVIVTPGHGSRIVLTPRPRPSPHQQPNDVVHLGNGFLASRAAIPY
jgi:cytochrome P450